MWAMRRAKPRTRDAGGRKRFDVFAFQRLPVAALPNDVPPRSTVHGYLDLWNWDGTLERGMAAF
jgi:hypothetical protein